MNHVTTSQFEEQIEYILDAPKQSGTVKMIVARPATNERKILDSCLLSAKSGTDGDHWARGCWKSLPDGSPHPDVQISVMNYRVLQVIEQDEERRALAGDNLCVDFDLSEENLQPGERLRIGAATVEVTSIPHNGCKKFAERFGSEALAYINSEEGKKLHLRGIYVRVVEDGLVRKHDTIEKW
ncbi:MOSC domain-containing protein [Pelagicoccus sp. NFK12]|uniref:MOSC domain-containing protein n=1 Tax=Pelagicoccus enzymogenes TaxID=2773457 RepID=A0A927F6T8_9BACT|nr:MOSC domain-containing protein [Pelagicoccus enzymogenes]MBD5778235.1 MOSC domain-containing protein [Pelagicoccus enzymogenes]